RRTLRYRHFFHRLGYRPDGASACNAVAAFRDHPSLGLMGDRSLLGGVFLCFALCGKLDLAHRWPTAVGDFLVAFGAWIDCGGDRPRVDGPFGRKNVAGVGSKRDGSPPGSRPPAVQEADAGPRPGETDARFVDPRPPALFLSQPAMGVARRFCGFSAADPPSPPHRPAASIDPAAASVEAPGVGIG